VRRAGAETPSAGPAVVDTGQRNQSAVEWQVVVGVGASNQESAVDVEDESDGVAMSWLEVHAQGSLQDSGEAGATVLRSGSHEPQSSSHEGKRLPSAEVVTGHQGDAQVSERPGAHGHVEALVAIEVLDGDSEGGDPAEGDTHPHALPGPRALGAQGHGRRRHQQGGDEKEPGRVTGAKDRGAHHGSRSIGRRAGPVHACGRTVAAAIALSLASCAPPDRPHRLGQDLPRAVLELLTPDTVTSAWVGDGVWYRYLWAVDGPWAVHLLEADLTRCDLALRALQAEARVTGGVGRETVSSMVARAGGSVMGAVNADFFTPDGRTVGSEVTGGRVRAARSRPAFAWRPGSDPWMGSTSVNGDSLWVGWWVHLESRDAPMEVVGGFPKLLEGGGRVEELGVSAATRHPRTGVAYETGRGRLWLVVVDGRRAPYSVGMTLHEFTDLLSSLGADEALNLDGGGSSVMVVRGRVRNRPSDEEGERPVVNALALVRDASGCGIGPATDQRSRRGLQDTRIPSARLRPGPGS
jgi:hypothetical protein